MRRFVLSLAVLALLFTVVGQAHADLIGTEVEYKYVIELFGVTSEFNTLKGPTMVDPTATFITNLGRATLVVVLDGSTSPITITYDITSGEGGISSTFGFNGPVLRSLEWDENPAAGEIIDFELLNVSADLTGQGFGDSNVSFDAHSIGVDWQGLQVITGSSFDITLQVSHSAPIPEPGTLLLIGSGLVGIGVGARRRNRRK